MSGNPSYSAPGAAAFSSRSAMSSPKSALPPSLALRSVGKILGGRRVVDGLDLEVAAGELLCILGPSGYGKTTTLRMIAGFLKPDSGRVLIDGKDMTELGAQHRPTAMVFQNYALWPHMTVQRNITFGLRARGMSKPAANDRAYEALKLVGLERHASRMPGGLSGGEQQRVALARAMVLEPTLLLMDEPLSNLDAQLRLRVREELVELQQRTGVTMIFVTHDQDEALSIAHRVAVMNAGRLDQVDPPAFLYRSPATAFVAGFVGRLNGFGAIIQRGSLVITWGEGSLSLPATPDYNHSPAGLAEGPVEVAIRPEEVLLTAAPGARDGRPVLDGPVLDGPVLDGPVLDGPVLVGTVARTLSRGHFDEVLVATALGTLRAYVAAGAALAGEVGVGFGRVLLYQSDRLVGRADGAGLGRPTNGPGTEGQTGMFAL
jgi:putative spermidine/putrescine transport system ATP-binding protein